jgi:hypothetical protein
VGAHGEPVAWTEIDVDAIHPTLARELCDLGILAIDLGAIEIRCAAAGIEMTRRGMVAPG